MRPFRVNALSSIGRFIQVDKVLFIVQVRLAGGLNQHDSQPAGSIGRGYLETLYGQICGSFDLGIPK